jgi:hypothetical protein
VAGGRLDRLERAPDGLGGTLDDALDDRLDPSGDVFELAGDLAPGRGSGR